MSSRPVSHVAFGRRLSQMVGVVLILGCALAQTPSMAQAGPAVTLIVNTTADTIDALPGNGVCADAGGNCSLRAAIMEANADPGSTIQFSATLNGTPIVLTRTGNDSTANAGDLDINANMNIVGNGAANTIVQAAADASYTGSIGDKVFGVNQSGLYNNLTVQFSGLTIRYGDNNIPSGDPTFAYTGGGVDVYFTGSGNSTTFTDCVISYNRSHTSYGGGLNVDSSAVGTNTLTLTRVTFSNNSTMSTVYTSNGGALNVFGNNVTVAIHDSTFANNTVPTASRYGGAIFFDPNSGSLTVDGTVFSGNSAQRGGAVWMTDNTATITTSQFTANTAADSGGAVSIGSGTLTLQYNRIVGNSATATPASGGLAVSGGTAGATNNWWGCNAGPGGTGCDKANSTGGTLTTSPWMILKTTANPGTISSGGAATLTAGVLQNSVGAALTPAQAAALVGAPVTWSNAVNGSFSGSQTSIQASGTATSTFTHNGVGCSGTAGGQAAIDNVQNADADATATITIQCPDLTVVKSNDAGGSVVLPAAWNWKVHVANGGVGSADFSDGETLLADTLPASGLTYGLPSISGASGLTGTATCAIDVSRNLVCAASGPVQLAAGGAFDVVFSATPGAGGAYANPRPAGSCAVDPDGTIVESSEANNACAGNTVTVNAPPSITSADTTTFTAGMAGSFTVTTSPGYPVSTAITRSGSLPAGLTFTDNGDGTATLAGTPDLAAHGNYPITITAANGVLPNATQSFTLVVLGSLQITNADHTLFVVGTPGSFTVTTAGAPLPTISESGALPGGVSFTDNGDGTATLSGMPAAGTGAVYALVLTASNGVAPDATQNFTLTVHQAPAITSADHTTFTAGSAGSFTVTTTGFPTNASMSIGTASSLPSGVTLTNNNDGTATLAGTPAAGTGGTYPLTISANNGVGTGATQAFTLTVDQGPVVLSVTSGTPNGSYTTGTVISVQVIFDENAIVTGLPQLTLETGAVDRIANYVGGSNSTTLNFSYTVQAGDASTDLDYAGTTALALNGGTIRDAAGNDANLTLPTPGAPASLGGSKAIVIDAVLPDTTITNDPFPAGLTNSTGVTFTYTGDDGTGVGGLTFACKLDAGAYVACNTGSIAYSALPDGSHTFQVRASDSLNNTDATPASYTWTVDTAGPTVTMSSAAPDPTNTSPIHVTVQFSQAVTGFAATDVVPGNAAVNNFAAVDGDTYTFDLAPAGQGLVTANIASAVAVDAAGNGNTAAAQFGRTYDSVGPTVTLEQAPGQPDPAGLSPVHFTATFSEPVTGFAGADVDLSASTTPGTLSAAITGGPTAYDVAVTGMTGDGTVIASIPALRVTDLAANGSAASTSSDNAVSYIYAAPPVIAEGSSVNVSMSEDGTPTPFSLTLHASDANSDPLSWSILTPAGFGVAGIDALSGVVSYVPQSNYNGSDSFVVQVSDGNGGTDSITVGVVIEPVGDTPDLVWNQSYSIKYDNWFGVVDPQAFGGGYRQANKPALFIFKIPSAATQFQWITYRGPDQGKAQILVDGVFKANVDLYRATPQWRYVVKIGGLTLARHIVTIKVLGRKNAHSTGTWVHVDGFKVAATDFDDNTIRFNDLYSYDSWVGLRNTSTRFGAYRLSGARDATMSFSFDGVQFVWFTARGRSYGKAAIYLDGVLRQTVDLYRAGPQWQYRIVVGGLPYGHHTVMIKVLGSKNPRSTGTGVVADGFEIE